MNKLSRSFAGDYQVYWANLSRLNNLLVICNISLFFLTELVTTQGYYYPFYSLFFIALVFIGLLVPVGLFDRLWYYLVFVTFELAGIYFLVASVAYWVGRNRL